MSEDFGLRKRYAVVPQLVKRFNWLDLKEMGRVRGREIGSALDGKLDRTRASAWCEVLSAKCYRDVPLYVRNAGEHRHFAR
jgi:hypothetical protein